MPRKNNRKPESLEESTRKDNARTVWRHNSFFGHARMMEVQARAIINSPTTTPSAKDLAHRIIETSQALGRALKERVK